MDVRALSFMVVLGLLSACSSPIEEEAPAPEALVTTAPVTRQNVDETVQLYGVADSGPGGKASLVAPIEARLVAIDAPVGTAVMQGQAVLHLSPGPTAALDIAKARTEAQTANAAYARALRLRSDGLVSDADVETARSAQANANAAVRSMTGKSLVLRAPLAGHVEAISAAPGDVIAAGTTMAFVSGNGAARARFGMEPGLIGQVKVGARISIARAGETKGGLVSVVSSVDPAVDSQTRLSSLYADLPTGSIRPGESLTGAVATGGGAASLVIPYGALLDDAGQPYVYVVARGIAYRRDIVTGASDGRHVAVLHGLGVGDNVVLEGAAALEDGMKVRLK